MLTSEHQCNLRIHPNDGHGPAIDDCEERADGTLWVYNSEYGTQVNFCPVCGFKAPVQVTRSDYRSTASR